MAIVLDATPGGLSSNSFATLAQSVSYHEGHLYGDSWINADEDLQVKALITATRLISDAGDVAGWLGWPTHASQALPMPRSGLQTRNHAAIDAMTIPLALANATSEYARRLIDAGAMPDATTVTAAVPGIKSLVVGPIEIEFDGSAVEAMGLELPEGVFSMIAFLFVSGAGSRMIRPLVRG